MLIINLLVVLMLRRRCCQCIANITIPGCPDLTEILEMDDREAKLAALNEIEAPFARVTYGIIRGCVGAVGGLALRVRRAPQKKLGIPLKPQEIPCPDHAGYCGQKKAAQVCQY